MSHNGQSYDRMERVEELVREFESAGDPSQCAAVAELVQLLMDLHGSALKRVLEIVRQTGAAGADIIERLSRDDLVAQILMLYDLHPVELETRVQQALSNVRPYLKSHGGDVELLSLDDGVVRLRLQGSCHGCPSSAQTLKNAIEKAIYESASDIAGLEVAGVTDGRQPAGFVPLETLRAR